MKAAASCWLASTRTRLDHARRLRRMSVRSFADRRRGLGDRPTSRATTWSVVTTPTASSSRSVHAVSGLLSSLHRRRGWRHSDRGVHFYRLDPSYLAFAGAAAAPACGCDCCSRDSEPAQAVFIRHVDATAPSLNFLSPQRTSSAAACPSTTATAGELSYVYHSIPSISLSS